MKECTPGGLQRHLRGCGAAHEGSSCVSWRFSLLLLLLHSQHWERESQPRIGIVADAARERLEHLLLRRVGGVFGCGGSAWWRRHDHQSGGREQRFSLREAQGGEDLDQHRHVRSDLDECYSSLPWKVGVHGGKHGPMGEDLFAQKCMELMGVAKQENFGLTTDGACEADRPTEEKKNKKFIPSCAGVSTPSIHPFKKPEAYRECWAQAASVH